MGRINFLSFVIFAAVISGAVSGVISSVPVPETPAPAPPVPAPPVPVSSLPEAPALVAPAPPVPAPPVPAPPVSAPPVPEPPSLVPELTFPSLAELGTIRVATNCTNINQTEEKSVTGSGASDVQKEAKSESEDDDGKKGREAEMSSGGQIQISDARDGSVDGENNAGAGSGTDARDNIVTILNKSHKKGNHILILNDGYPGKVVIVNGQNSKENL